MKPRKFISQMGTIKEGAHKCIVDELKARGVEGIVPSHGAILHELFKSGSLPMSEIAQRIKRKQPTVTVLVDKLVKLGYAAKERDSEDSRVMNITITGKGRDFKPLVDEVSLEMIKRFGTGLSEGELDVLEALLAKMLKNC